MVDEQDKEAAAKGDHVEEAKGDHTEQAKGNHVHVEEAGDQKAEEAKREMRVFGLKTTPSTETSDSKPDAMHEKKHVACVLADHCTVACGVRHISIHLAFWPWSWDDDDHWLLRLCITNWMNFLTAETELPTSPDLDKCKNQRAINAKYMEMQTLGLVHKSNPLTFNFLFGLIFWHSGQQPRIQSKIRAYNGRWGLHAVLQGWLGWHFGQHDHTKTPKWEYQFFVSNLLIVGQLPPTHTIWGLAISCHRFRLMKGILARSILRLKHTVKKLQMKREKSIKWFSFGHLSWIIKKKCLSTWKQTKSKTWFVNSDFFASVHWESSLLSLDRSNNCSLLHHPTSVNFVHPSTDSDLNTCCNSIVSWNSN